jgi:hypothetical protein
MLVSLEKLSTAIAGLVEHWGSTQKKAGPFDAGPA